MVEAASGMGDDAGSAGKKGRGHSRADTPARPCDSDEASFEEVGIERRHAMSFSGHVMKAGRPSELFRPENRSENEKEPACDHDRAAHRRSV